MMQTLYKGEQMKKIILFSMIIISSMFLSGCATNENFVKQHNEWIGKNINDYIARSGYPDDSYEIPNGNKVYVYNKSTRYIFHGSPIGFGYFGRRGYFGGFPMGYGFYEPDVIVRSCTLFIETNKQGKIVKWGSKGNNCIADEPRK